MEVARVDMEEDEETGEASDRSTIIAIHTHSHQRPPQSQCTLSSGVLFFDAASRFVPWYRHTIYRRHQS